MAITDEIPKSRLTLTYRTEVSGKRQEKSLPFRMVVMGDLSLESPQDAVTESAERKMDLDARPIRDLTGNNLDAVMREMGISIKFRVPNKISGGEIDVALPIDSMRAFRPESIVERVEQLKALVLFKKLLVELQGNLDNRKEFRNLVREFNGWRRRIKEIPGEIALIEEQARTETDPGLKNRMELKVQKLQEEKEAAEKSLTAFLTHLEDALKEYQGFKLPGGEPAAAQ